MSAKYIAKRLSALLLERLPKDLRQEAIGLLPEDLLSEDWFFRSLQRMRAERGYEAWAYPDLVAQASRSFFDRFGEHFAETEYCEKVVDAFLWAFAKEFSADLKFKLTQSLPVDLRSRMNLYASGDEAAKVA